MSKAMPRNQRHKMNGYPIYQDSASVLTVPSFGIDPIDPENEWAYDQYRGARDWENAADFMDRKNKGGLVVEQTPEANVSYRSPLQNYEYGRLPKGLVQGRTFFGLPGGRSGRGVGTAKRMSKGNPYSGGSMTNSGHTNTSVPGTYPSYGGTKGTNQKVGPNIMSPSYMKSMSKSLHKASISVPDKLKSMINGLLGVGRFNNVSPAAVAAALIANKKGGSSGMRDYPAPGTSRASASRSSAIGPRKQDITLNALIRSQMVRDPENPNFNPPVRERRYTPSSGNVDKRMMKSSPNWGERAMMEALRRQPFNAGGEMPPRSSKVPFTTDELMHGMKRRANGGGSRGMMKSISSMNQGGVRHVVGGYRGGKMSKAMAASQTQTKNRYM